MNEFAEVWGPDSEGQHYGRNRSGTVKELTLYEFDGAVQDGARYLPRPDYNANFPKEI